MSLKTILDQPNITMSCLKTTQEIIQVLTTAQVDQIAYYNYPEIS